MMGSLSRTNKIYVVRYTDKYGNAHSASYACKDNAEARYAVEFERSKSVTLTLKKRRFR